MKYVAIVLFFLGGYTAWGQTCTGGLGDPIVNITFGSGGNFGPALAPGITSLLFVPGPCPSDGSYTITNGIDNNCFSGAWFNVLRDHTGDNQGYFMLINASFEPSDFYVQTVNGLCPGTTYQFAAWALNMVAGPDEILPNITFQIEKPDGTILGDTSVSIPETSSPQWKQYGFIFTTPPGVSSVVIRMTNHAPGGIGNDLAIDDITFRASGPTVNLQVTSYGSDTVTLCQNDPTVLSFTASVSSCYSSTDYQWQQSIDSGKTWVDIPGATTTSFARPPTAPGNYLYRLKTAQTGNIGSATCSVASDPIEVVVTPIPVPVVGITATAVQICAGLPDTFHANSLNGGNAPAFQWLVNGAPAGAGTDTFTTTTLKDGDVVTCILTSNAFCVQNPTAVSNAATIAVIPDAVTAVTISSSAVTICRDSNVVFTATPSNGGSAPFYQWTINGLNAGPDNAVFITPALQNGDVVSCVMTGSELCSLPVNSGNSIPMTVFPLPVIQLTPDTIIAAGGILRLNPIVTGDIVSYQWSPPTYLDNTTIPSPLSRPIGNTIYTLQVVSKDGCVASASEAVNVFYDLLMPGGFTPNGDGKNDVFRVPPSVPVKIIGFVIFDRWGLRVFSTTGSNEGWDGTYKGKPQPTGVYVWQIEYEDLILKKAVTKGGTVVLVR